jgi:Ankyrin repeats (3 copies)/Ankyrin repeat
MSARWPAAIFSRSYLRRRSRFDVAPRRLSGLAGTAHTAAMSAPDSSAEVAELYARADAAANANQRDEAAVLARQVLALAPTHLDALHLLHFLLIPLLQLVWRPGQEQEAAEQRAIRDRVLAATEGTPLPDASAGAERTLPQRARALALAFHVLDQPLPGTAAEGAALLARAREAVALRSMLYTTVALQRAELAAAIAEDPPAGYRRLLDWVAANPEHTAGPRYDDFGPASCQGLEDLFALPGFVEWARVQPVPAAGPAQPSNKAVLLAAGKDAEPRYEQPGAPGRAGRLAALRALGYSLDVRGYQDRAPIHLAAAAGDLDAIELLAGLGADVRVADDSNATPLHLAAEHGQAHVISTLLGLGAELEARDDMGHTPLFAARSAEVVRALVSAGATVDTTRSSDDSTPLHLAVLVASEEVVLALLAAGADPRRTRADVGKRKSAIDLALSHNRAALARKMGATAQSGVDLAPLRDALTARTPEILARWYWPKEYWGGGGAKDLARISALLDSLELEGASWDRLAKHLHGVTPWISLAIAELLRDAVPAEPSPAAFTGTPRLVLGDLHIPGDLHVTGPLVVTGDLIVDGTLRDSDHDSLIAIGGSLRAHAVISCGELGVAKDLDATLVWGFYNDHSIVVNGTLRCKVLLNDDHDIRAQSEEVEHEVDLREEPEGVRTLFAAELLDEEGNLDLALALPALRAGGGLRD